MKKIALTQHTKVSSVWVQMKNGNENGENEKTKNEQTKWHNTMSAKNNITKAIFCRLRSLVRLSIRACFCVLCSSKSVMISAVCLVKWYHFYYKREPLMWKWCWRGNGRES